LHHTYAATVPHRTDRIKQDVGGMVLPPKLSQINKIQTIFDFFRFTLLTLSIYKVAGFFSLRKTGPNFLDQAFGGWQTGCT
jgi:hypothetical protein